MLYSGHLGQQHASDIWKRFKFELLEIAQEAVLCGQIAGVFDRDHGDEHAIRLDFRPALP